MFAVLNRSFESVVQTLGYMYFYNDKGTQLLRAATLELPDRNNQTSISRIIAKTYWVEKRWSKKYGWHLHILDVDGRTLILIHFGNYYTQTRGCVLVGNNHRDDINRDGVRDVTVSRRTLGKIMKIVPYRFKLIINDAA